MFGGDVPGQDRRDRHRGRDLRAPAAPLHAGAAVLGPGSGPDAARQARGHPAHRGRAQPGEPAVRLPVPHPLLEGAGEVRRGSARAGGPAGQPPGGLPLRGRTAESRLLTGIEVGGTPATRSLEVPSTSSS